MPMVSLSVDETLMNQFDQIHQRLGFSSRSEALREAIILFNKHHQENMDLTGHHIARINVVHEILQTVANEFSSIEKKYEHVIKSIDEYNLKQYKIVSLLVAGDGEEIDDLYNSLTRSKNFKVILSYIPVPKE